MFQEKYQKLYDGIEPEEALLEHMIRESQRSPGEGRKISAGFIGKSYRKGRRTGMAGKSGRFILVTAAVLCIMISGMPVIAANSNRVYDLIYTLSPKLANYFVPVRETVESQGVTAGVESVYALGKQAQLYISLQGSDEYPIDQDTTFAGNCYLEGIQGRITDCILADYDYAGNTAIYHLTVKAQEEIRQNQKFVFGIRKINGSAGTMDGHWEITFRVEKMENTLFFDEGITEERIAEICAYVDSHYGIEARKYITAEEAWQQFSEEYLDEEQKNAFQENPLGDSENYSFTMYVVEKDVDKIQQELQAIPGVRKVRWNLQG
ncbi:MAG: permease-like cell division protein FtsX [Lachnospiraceae bacterium]|nr:permease-like cell division protein FtsX [Lachnospiraceae bacterium]